MNKNKQVDQFSNDELEKELITLDFHGKDFKQKCLSELLSREYQRGKDDGAYYESFYNSGS